VPDIIVKPSRSEEEKEVLTPKLPTERDLERHLMEVGKGEPKEKEKSKKEEVKEKKPADNQLERALELLKSWEIFNNIAKGNK
jgi:chromatin segregation and condensation protein Rec8/ScpA/Scc1 (kleisin family)